MTSMRSVGPTALWVSGPEMPFGLGRAPATWADEGEEDSEGVEFMFVRAEETDAE